jgi:cytochrome c oxidase assembly protein subunit 15
MMSLAPSAAGRRAVRFWLLAVAALMFVTVIVGGATRLTESGLSIVEWKPVTGVVPPLDARAWQAEFDKYKTIPQYRERHAGMSLDEFKTIYWWEWTHRLLARLVGAAFLLPLLWFLWRGWIEPSLRPRLWTIFALGASLGLVGWLMVASGLSERLRVSQYWLAFHLTLACLIFAAVVWTAQSLLPRAAVIVPRRIRSGALAVLALVILQIYLGALVSGLRAGLIYNTWPLIDGSLVPEGSRLFFYAPLWRNFFENTLTVQFDHRMLAYALEVLVLLHVIDVARTLRGGPALTTALVLASAVTLQAALGITTLLHQAPLALALPHQAMALVVLAIAVVNSEALAPRAAGTKKAATAALDGDDAPLSRGDRIQSPGVR